MNSWHANCWYLLLPLWCLFGSWLSVILNVLCRLWVVVFLIHHWHFNGLQKARITDEGKQAIGTKQALQWSVAKIMRAVVNSTAFCTPALHLKLYRTLLVRCQRTYILYWSYDMGNFDVTVCHGSCKIIQEPARTNCLTVLHWYYKGVTSTVQCAPRILALLSVTKAFSFCHDGT